ncbi:hypothetical protein [Tatumella sp. UCD-D_suzukii]|uniref:hypothetical protein n=1 Tax=Tatumella sp. UCD-D_suzukii TaxID=1408192 RepID=UPI000A4F9E8D|nr:hypothetical protein [Tatumella sp. UCD-D_suzukii]
MAGALMLILYGGGRRATFAACRLPLLRGPGGSFAVTPELPFFYAIVAHDFVPFFSPSCHSRVMTGAVLPDDMKKNARK